MSTLDVVTANALINSLPCGVLVLGERNQIHYANHTMADLLHKDLEQLLNQSLTAVLTGSARLFYLTHVLPMMQYDGLVEEMYMQLKLPDGSRLPVLFNGRKVMVGEQEQFELVLFPIHRRYVFEDQLIAQRKRAEQAVAEKEEALQSLQQAQQDLQAKQLELSSLINNWQSKLQQTH